MSEDRSDATPNQPSGGARETLRGVIQTYGPDVRQDPRRCEALLRDLCPGDKRDVNLLLSALRERVPDELLAGSAGQPPAVLVARLGRRLSDTLGLTDEAARWAVGSWAVALGVASEADLPAPAPPPAHAPPPYTPPQYAPPAPPPTPLPPPPPWRQPPFPPPGSPQPPGGPARSGGAAMTWASAGVAVAVVSGLAVMTLSRKPRPLSSGTSLGAYQPAAATGYGGLQPAPADPAGLPALHWDAAKPVTAVALTRDGHTVATGGFKIITLWDAATGKKVRDIRVSPPPNAAKPEFTPVGEPQPGEVTRLSFSPDGKRLASNDYGVITVWNAQTGQKEYTPALPTEEETDTDIGVGAGGGMVRSVNVRQVPMTNDHFLMFSPDGRLLVADAGSSIATWDAQTGRRRSQFAKADATALALSPDGRTQAGGGASGAIHLWDAQTGALRHGIRVPSTSAADDPYGHAQFYKDLSAVAFSPDGRTLATANEGDRHVRLWDAATAARQRVLATGDESVSGLALRPDGSLVCFQQSGGLTLRDGATGKVLHAYHYQAPGALMADTFDPRPRSFALSADGQTLVAGGNGNTMADKANNTVVVWKVTK